MKKRKWHIEGTQESKWEPRTINPAKLPFVYKEHRGARIQGILFPWALSETSTRGWASGNRNEQREVNVRMRGITHSYFHAWGWMTGEVQEGAWWLNAQCINRHSTPMFYIDLGEIQDSTPEELTDNCFWIRARLWGRRCRRSSARKQIDIRQSGRRFQIIEAWFWLFTSWTLLWYRHWNRSKWWKKC